MTDDDGAGRSRGPFDALGALDDVQRQALEAARRVASGLGDLGGMFGETPWTNAGDRAGGGGTASAADVGRLRGDIMRAAETFADLVRASLDVGFDALDELARRPADRPTGAVEPGAVIQITCTVRNEGEPLRSGRPLVPGLVASDGVSLDAVVTCRPAVLDLEPYERAAVTVDVHVAPTAIRGRYHGLLLVTGLAGVAEPLSVEVVDAEGSDDEH